MSGGNNSHLFVLYSVRSVQIKGENVVGISVNRVSFGNNTDKKWRVKQENNALGDASKDKNNKKVKYVVGGLSALAAITVAVLAIKKGKVPKKNIAEVTTEGVKVQPPKPHIPVSTPVTPPAPKPSLAGEVSEKINATTVEKPNKVAQEVSEVVTKEPEKIASKAEVPDIKPAEPQKTKLTKAEQKAAKKVKKSENVHRYTNGEGNLVEWTATKNGYIEKTFSAEGVLKEEKIISSGRGRVSKISDIYYSDCLPQSNVLNEGNSFSYPTETITQIMYDGDKKYVTTHKIDDYADRIKNHKFTTKVYEKDEKGKFKLVRREYNKLFEDYDRLNAENHVKVEHLNNKTVVTIQEEGGQRRIVRDKKGKILSEKFLPNHTKGKDPGNFNGGKSSPLPPSSSGGSLESAPGYDGKTKIVLLQRIDGGVDEVYQLSDGRYIWPADYHFPGGRPLDRLAFHENDIQRQYKIWNMNSDLASPIIDIDKIISKEGLESLVKISVEDAALAVKGDKEALTRIMKLLEPYKTKEYSADEIKKLLEDFIAKQALQAKRGNAARSVREICEESIDTAQEILL